MIGEYRDTVRKMIESTGLTSGSVLQNMQAVNRLGEGLVSGRGRVREVHRTIQQAYLRRDIMRTCAGNRRRQGRRGE